MKILKNKENKQIFLSALLLVIIIALYVEINVLISKANIPKFDVTEDKAYSLSNESREEISKLDKDVKIILVGLEEYKDNTLVENVIQLVNEFDRASERISTEIYEKQSEEENPYIIFECGDTARKVWLNELYQYKYNSIYAQNEELYMIEPMITNSIIGIVGNSSDKIYICMDKSVYGEKYYTSFVSIASALGFDTYGLNLSEDMKIPDDCKCLVIVPLASTLDDGTIVMTDFTDEEKNLIIEYINNGGNILFLQESKSLIGIETPNLDYLMSMYGVSISDGIVCKENDSSDRISYIYPEINISNNLFKYINNESRVCLFDSGFIEISDDKELNISQYPILKANKNSFVRSNLSNSKQYKTDEDEDASERILGIYVEKKVGDNTSKAIVYSNSVMATNTPISIKDNVKNKNVSVEAILLDNNSELIVDSLRVLMNKNDAIYSIKNKYNYIPSGNILTDNITLKIMFVIPMIILIIGYAVWRHRKNKK